MWQVGCRGPSCIGWRRCPSSSRIPCGAPLLFQLGGDILLGAGRGEGKVKLTAKGKKEKTRAQKAPFARTILPIARRMKLSCNWEVVVDGIDTINFADGFADFSNACLTWPKLFSTPKLENKSRKRSTKLRSNAIRISNHFNFTTFIEAYRLFFLLWLCCACDVKRRVSIEANKKATNTG